jgi:putative ABC transport system substrate-binding protein
VAGRQVIDSAVASLGFEARTYWVSNREDFDAAFASTLEARAQAILVDFTALTVRERQRIVDFSNRNRLPSVFGATEFVKAGGLISYGANRLGMMDHSFASVDKILRGARPTDLPVELPTKFDLVINLKTARPRPRSRRRCWRGRIGRPIRRDWHAQPGAGVMTSWIARVDCGLAPRRLTRS